MGVDDRRDRPAPLPGIGEQLFGMFGMAAGIDHDQPSRRVEEDAVAVRALVERDRAGDEGDSSASTSLTFGAAAPPSSPAIARSRNIRLIAASPFGERLDHHKIVRRQSSFDEVPAELASVNPRLRLDVLDLVGERIVVDRAVIDPHRRRPCRPSRRTRRCVCFIQFLSSRSGKSSCTWAPRLSLRLAAQCMVTDRLGDADCRARASRSGRCSRSGCGR